MSVHRLLALLLAASVFAAACGDDDDSEPAQTGDPTEDTGDTDETDETDETDDAGTDPEGAEDTTSESDASVSFAAPADGDTVAPRFDVEMAAEGISVAPAGAVVEGEGHFHVMIDVGCVDAGETIPSDDAHRHFGKAQTGTQLFLEPGEHALCLQMADGEHTALDVTDEITVTVDDNVPYVSLGLPEGDLTSPLDVTMEAQNFTVAEAGAVVEGEGHFHIMVDVPCVAAGETVPSDDAHLHYGKAQTEATLELEAGTHTLCLQMADGEHTALDLTHVVTVEIV